MLLCVYYILVWDSESASVTANLVGPLWLSVTLAIAARRLAIAHRGGLWTGLFWLRAGTVVYFGIGAIIPRFLNETTRMRIDAFHAATTEEILKVNLITSVAVLLLLSTVKLAARLARASPLPERIGRDDLVLMRFGMLFGAIGLLVRYTLVLPYEFGLSKFALPGFLLQLGLLVPVGIFMVGSWIFRFRKAFIIPFTALVLLDLAFGLLLFSKTQVLFTLIMYLLAYTSMRPSTGKVAFAAVSCFAVYFFIVPVVDFGRTMMLERYGSITGGGVTERIEIVSTYFTDPNARLRMGSRDLDQSGLARFSFMNQSAFAVALRDSGIGSQSLWAVVIAPIPRVLWPDKPNMNYLAAGFNKRATGSTTSLSWPGQYVEAYWTLGWWGIPLFMIPAGFVYFFVSRFAINVFAAGRWAFFPVVLFGMRFGTELTSAYPLAVVGGSVYIVAVYLACRIIERTLPSSFRQRPMVAAAFAAGRAHRR